MAPLNKENDRTAIEIACIKHSQAMHLKAPHIIHMVSALLIGFALHREEPGGVSNTINIFMLPDLSLA